MLIRQGADTGSGQDKPLTAYVLGDRQTETANARERQRRAHKQKINALALVSLPFKRSGTTHKRPAAPTL
jgi:hypothetical protein